MVNQFGKKLLVASVLAAVSGVANAAAPTLGEVLKASSIDVTGYIDAAFNYRSTNDTASTSAATYHAYDVERSSFLLHAVDLTVSSLPSSGFGGLAEFQFGNDANFNASQGSSNSSENVLQAFVQYATGPVSILAGKFTTLAGAEVAQQPANSNYSRSFLYTLAIPVTHTGVRGVYTVNDSLKFTAGINNGWDALKTSAKSNGADGKTIELGVSATPIKPLALTGTIYTGNEAGVGTDSGTRTLIDLVATYTISDSMSAVLNIDSAKQENDAAGTEVKWSGVAANFNYTVGDWRFSPRVEYFKDKDGFRTSVAQKLKEVTFTVGYAAAKNAELRFEVRQDKSDQTPWMKDGVAKDKQMTLGVEALLKF
jgi:hypothetical protein